VIIYPELREPPECHSAAHLPLEAVVRVGLAALPVSDVNIWQTQAI